VSAQDRAAYLEQVCKLLWPAPAEVAFTSSRAISTRPKTRTADHLNSGHSPDDDTSGGDTNAADTSLLVLPGLGSPRLLVPQERRAGSAGLRRYGEPGSVRSKLATRALSATVATGLGGLVLPDRLLVRVPAGAETIDSYLSSVLGHRVLLSMHIGAARANRKPVLQLLTHSGKTVGFAKVGHNPLTAALVRAEHDALSRLGAGLNHLQAPHVLSFTSWRGMEVLVLSPMPVWQKRTPLRSGQLAKAIAEVAAVSGLRHSPVADSRYWQTLTARLEETRDAGADACRTTLRSAGSGGPQGRDVGPGHGDYAALRAALDELAIRAGTTVLAFGSWHGDWTPWNMASTRAGLLVWDWERFTSGVPAGFDALHCWLQTQVINGRRDPARTAVECLQRAPALLDPLGVAPAQARVTALLYLADLSVRYLADRQDQAGARLGAPGKWLLPALTSGIGALSAGGSHSPERR
jgi:hypothetical protein